MLTRLQSSTPAPRQRAPDDLRGLLSPVERKNGWRMILRQRLRLDVLVLVALLRRWRGQSSRGNELFRADSIDCGQAFIQEFASLFIAVIRVSLSGNASLCVAAPSAARKRFALNARTCSSTTSVFLFLGSNRANAGVLSVASRRWSCRFPIAASSRSMEFSRSRFRVVVDELLKPLMNLFIFPIQ
ncbi:hypothetical protein [Ralstonia solanacearum]|uniref:hypothetical protein n=1 Tax=Ralstonia solanacearum TaxID=305 RepID=UPI0013C34BDC|nr:hypothetical protein [Ralstonia solanacearum]